MLDTAVRHGRITQAEVAARIGVTPGPRLRGRARQGKARLGLVCAKVGRLLWECCCLIQRPAGVVVLLYTISRDGAILAGPDAAGETRGAGGLWGSR